MIEPVRYQLQFRPYQRQFRRPLQTHHGLWQRREGILLKLTDEAGKIGWGEIAPIAWFGSETLEQAWEFCVQLPSEITEAMIFSIPDDRPACQFGFESALSFHSPPFKHQASSLSALLPPSQAALREWETLWDQGHRTFKWKIGVEEIDSDFETLLALMKTMPSQTKLRLDANGGLTAEQADRWLAECDRFAQIEYLEQPLPVTEFAAMQQLSQQHTTPIALDESVATLAQLKTCYEAGWRGVFVVKPAIAGSPTRLRQFCRDHAIDAVFSSALETAIGQQAGLRLAAELSNPKRAIGYGTAHWFADSEPEFEQWQHL